MAPPTGLIISASVNAALLWVRWARVGVGIVWVCVPEKETLKKQPPLLSECSEAPFICVEVKNICSGGGGACLRRNAGSRRQKASRANNRSSAEQLACHGSDGLVQK